MFAPRNRILTRTIQVGIITAAVGVVACTDWGASAPITGVKPVSELVATGQLYNTIWQPSAGFASGRSFSFPVAVTSKEGVVLAEPSGPLLPDENRSSALALHNSFVPSTAMSGIRSSSPSAGLMVAQGRVSKISIKARTVLNTTVDGKRIRLARSPDDDRASGRPSKATVIYQNDRIAAILEFKYTKQSGAWRVSHTSATLIDSAGKVAFVLEQDASGLSYGGRGSDLGVVGEIRAGLGRAVFLATKMVQPDVLYAAPPGSAFCLLEWAAAGAAAAAVVGAEANLAAAELAAVAAAAGAVVAAATCLAQPELCPALAAGAAAATASAAAWVESAWVLLGGAVVASGIAEAALAACVLPHPESEAGPSGGGSEGGNCPSGEEEWCEWTIWRDGGGNVVDVVLNSCWCQ
jgi:hypothetical protein